MAFRTLTGPKHRWHLLLSSALVSVMRCFSDACVYTVLAVIHFDESFETFVDWIVELVLLVSHANRTIPDDKHDKHIHPVRAIPADKRISPVLSSAQRCIDDILLEIFAYLQENDMAQVARVCKSWFPACRMRLYTRIRIDEGRSPVQAVMLCNSLREQPLLGSFVRQLEISHFKAQRDGSVLFSWISCMRQLQISHFKPRREGSFLNSWMSRMPADYSWISCFPPDGIWSLDVGQVDPDYEFQRAILQAPFRQNIRRLTLRSKLVSSVSVLNACLSWPGVESLAFYLPQCHEDLDLRSPPPLKRLSIVAYDFSPEITALLLAVKTTIEQFDLSITYWEDPSDLINALASQVSSLRRLSIEPSDSTSTAFMDRLVPLLPSLEYLSCGFGTYTPALFGRIPASIRTLKLHSSERLARRLKEVVILVDRVRKGQSELRSLIIIHHDVQVPLNALREACLSAQIAFNCSDQGESHLHVLDE